MVVKSEKSELVGLVVFILLSLTLFYILFYTPKLFGFASSAITVYITPEFNHSNPISDQSFTQGTSLSDVFDLDNHFSDGDSSTLTYKAFGNSSVSVSVNGSNVVSYSAPSSFSGTNVLTFYAYDELDLNASSNNVTITVNAVGGAGGGGGGGVSLKKEDPFKFEPEELEVRLRHGEAQIKSFTIKNNLKKPIIVNVDFRDLQDFILFRGRDVDYIIEDFSLSPFEEKIIEITFFADENIAPDAFLRKIIFQAEKSQKQLPVIVVVSSREFIFDISLKIPSKFKEILAGESIKTEIKVFRVSGFGEAEVAIDLAIKDFSGNVIATKGGVVSVASGKNEFLLEEELEIPAGTALGKYLLVVKATHEEKSAVASDTFNVVEKIYRGFNYLQLLIILIAVLSLAVLVLITYYLRILLKIRAISQLILEAHKEVSHGHKREAVRVYNSIRERFNELPLFGKRRIWGEIHSLGRRLHVMHEKEIMLMQQPKIELEKK